MYDLAPKAILPCRFLLQTNPRSDSLSLSLALELSVPSQLGI